MLNMPPHKYEIVHQEYHKENWKAKGKTGESIYNIYNKQKINMFNM